jgi:hypothetical protein
MAISRNTQSSIANFNKFNQTSAGFEREAGPGVFVAICDNTTAFNSTDGFTWTTRSKPTLYARNNLNFVKGRFQAFPLATTPDGVTWTEETASTSAASKSFNATGALRPTTKELVIANSDGNNVQVINIQSRLGALSVGFGATLLNGYHTAFFGNDLAATIYGTSSSQRLTTINLETYAVTSITTVNINANFATRRQLASDGQALIAAGNNGLYRFTSPTDTGTLVRSGTAVSVFYENGLWIAGTGLSGEISTSPDGITWTNRTSQLTGILNQVAFGNGVWVISDTNRRIATSPDGITWTFRTTLSSELTGLAFA